MPPETLLPPATHEPPGSGQPRPATFLDGVERVLLRIILVALVVLALLLGFAAWHARQQRGVPAIGAVANATTNITLVIDYGDGVRKTFTDLAAIPGMTVHDAMTAANAHTRPLAFTITGSGDTIRLTSIDDVKDEGMGLPTESKRNWQYWIDGTYGMTSIGVAKVAPGQRVSWAFRPYDREPKPPAP